MRELPPVATRPKILPRILAAASVLAIPLNWSVFQLLARASIQRAPLNPTALQAFHEAVPHSAKTYFVLFSLIALGQLGAGLFATVTATRENRLAKRYGDPWPIVAGVAAGGAAVGWGLGSLVYVLDLTSWLHLDSWAIQ